MAEASSCSSTREKVQSNKCHRSALFETALQKTANHFISSIKLSLFNRHYGEIYKRDPKGLTAVHQQFVDELRKNVLRQLKQYVTKENIPQLLNKLDELIKRQDDKLEQEDPSVFKPAWRPTGVPQKDFRPHAIAIKLKAKVAVITHLLSLEEEDGMLTKETFHKKHLLLELKRALDDKMMVLEEGARACHTLPLDEIKAFMEETNDSGIND